MKRILIKTGLVLIGFVILLVFFGLFMIRPENGPARIHGHITLIGWSVFIAYVVGVWRYKIK